ncbi:sarcosine oxidase [Thozetella sp. PMI_491]|nr:sarcosine oxidase [Thozetella sp. PMI_491]
MAAASYIVVGAGVFGASTALYLIRKYPNAQVRLVDRNAFTASTRVAASWDWNKVVRAEYGDIAYVRLALEARDLWSKDPLWRDYYHETGIYWISHGDFADDVFKNYEQLGAKPDLKLYPVEEARKLYDGLFDEADYTGVKKVLVNKNSGYADAKEALQRTIQAAVDLGVEYIEGEVATLDLEGGSDGACTGIILVDGTKLAGEKVILSTGAYTPKLLADSAPQRAALHAGGRILAIGVTEAIGPVSGQVLPSLKAMPVAIQPNPIGRGESNGGFPPNKDQQLKYWAQTIFRNTTAHPASGQEFSVPPSGPDYDQWKVPSILKDDVRFAHKAILGSYGKDIELDHFRICWDALTPSEDFIISPHSACSNLYIATCGSFHGFKFLPVLGKYVVEMLDGVLEPELAQKWAWDREQPPTDDKPLWTSRELKDLLD